MQINDTVYLPHLKSLGVIKAVGEGKKDKGFYDVKINFNGADIIFSYYITELELIKVGSGVIEHTGGAIPCNDGFESYPAHQTKVEEIKNGMEHKY